MPLESAGKDDVYVGRIRKDLADEMVQHFGSRATRYVRAQLSMPYKIAEYLIKVGNVK